MSTDISNPFAIVNNGAATSGSDFEAALRQHDQWPLKRVHVKTVQLNVGKLCNQACHHCHIDAGPKRTEMMPRDVAERVIELLSNSPRVETVDITGGAPELNPYFRFLVTQSRRLGKHIIDRCNLTVLFEPDMEDLSEFLAVNEVEIIASLPCYTAANVDGQRGRGVFDKSVRALQLLNRRGYGMPGSPLQLNLVYNPLGASLPPSQDKLEADFRKQLREHFNIEFHRLFTMTNVPVKRFSEQLARAGQYESYMDLLANHFNRSTVDSLMCRSLASVGWHGGLYDCDFNQVLEIGATRLGGKAYNTIWDIRSYSDLDGWPVATGSHCFGCTAGCGSSCGGSLQ
jgi:radical SAM/Cys-rich protein